MYSRNSVLPQREQLDCCERPDAMRSVWPKALCSIAFIALLRAHHTYVDSELTLSGFYSIFLTLETAYERRPI